VLDLPTCLEMTVDELRRLRALHDHWGVAWSVGKDSTTLATVTAHAIEAGLVERPKTLKLIRSDTEQELAPLNHAAEQHGARVRRARLGDGDRPPRTGQGAVGEHPRARRGPAELDDGPVVYQATETRPDGRVRPRVDGGHRVPARSC
jgi:3'-phosphoadenosine 5'-phosphosulfate sulfotransferase (PAPS reductase)/FAD synthetase